MTEPQQQKEEWTLEKIANLLGYKTKWKMFFDWSFYVAMLVMFWYIANFIPAYFPVECSPVGQNITFIPNFTEITP